MNLLLAVSITLVWNPSPTPDIAYYRLYVGIQSIKAGNPALVFYDTGQLQQQVNGLELGTQYFFVVTAWKEGLESVYSDEVVYTPPIPTPTPEPTPTVTPTPTPTPTPEEPSPTPGKWWKKNLEELLRRNQS